MIRYAGAAVAALLACAPATAGIFVVDFANLNTGTNVATVDTLEFTLSGPGADIFDGTPVEFEAGQELLVRYTAPAGDLNNVVNFVGVNGTLPLTTRFNLFSTDGQGSASILDFTFIGNGNAAGVGVFGVPRYIVGSEYRLTSTGPAVFSRIALAPVPEPSAWALMIIGFGAVGYAARRRLSFTNSSVA